MANLYGGIEAGGSHFVCAIGAGPDDARETARFPTQSPDETIERTIQFFLDFQTRNLQARLKAIGIGSFGPVDLDEASPTWGYITSTPKPGWANTDFGGRIARALGIRVVFDTDVNAAAEGEHRCGAAQRLDTFIYLTVGTGIGGGAMVNGRLLHGMSHPEMGHIRIPHDLKADPFDGVCPFHGDCLEGLASGPALRERWRADPRSLPDEHPAWGLEAHYLALGLSNLICTLSPQRIILGGGVMERRHLFPLIRQKVQELLAGYIPTPQILSQIDSYIVPAALGDRAGVLGAIALAMKRKS
jgi:fructokinase